MKLRNAVVRRNLDRSNIDEGSYRLSMSSIGMKLNVAEDVNACIVGCKCKVSVDLTIEPTVSMLLTYNGGKKK